MKSLMSVLVLGAVAALTGCSTEPNSELGTDTVKAGTASEAVTVLDCQKQVATCSKAAKSFADFGKCTTQFQSCTTQAALDLAGQGTLLSTCRAKSTKCLQGALTVSDVSACRDIYNACTADVKATASDVLGSALQTAKDAIAKTEQIATGLISDATGTVGAALDALGNCESKANACLTSAVTVGQVLPCQDAFDTCAGDAVKLADGVVASLPIPTATDVLTALSQCQAESAACLKGAVTISDVSACKSVLSTCVTNANALVDTVVTDVNTVLPVPVPTPTQIATCTAAATECLLKLTSPIDCLTQQTLCLTQ